MAQNTLKVALEKELPNKNVARNVILFLGNERIRMNNDIIDKYNLNYRPLTLSQVTLKQYLKLFYDQVVELYPGR